MKLLCTVLFSVCLLAAQETEKPNPKQKARELLDAAAEMVGGTQREIQVVGLLHLGDNYQAFDRAKSLEFLQQAFAAAGTLPEDRINNRTRLQANIVGLTVGVDLAAAEEMLRQIAPSVSKDYDPRWPAISKVVTGLVEKKDFDHATELEEGIGSTGFYCFTAAGSILRRCRRTIRGALRCSGRPWWHTRLTPIRASSTW